MFKYRINGTKEVLLNGLKGDSVIILCTSIKIPSSNINLFVDYFFS